MHREQPVAHPEQLLEELLRVADVPVGDLPFQPPHVLGQRGEVVAHAVGDGVDQRARQLAGPGRVQRALVEPAGDRRGLDVGGVERDGRVHRPVHGEHPVRPDELVELDEVHVPALPGPGACSTTNAWSG